MELPYFVFQAKGVAAVRGLEKPAKDQTRQTRRSPTYSRHNLNTGAEKAGHYVMCCDPAGFPDPVADSSATTKS
jgi:hypothetical protein